MAKAIYNGFNVLQNCIDFNRKEVSKGNEECAIAINNFSNVSEQIVTIASQTNLLALNAASAVASSLIEESNHGPF